MFSLMQHHKYSMTEIYDMYPYERDLFLELLMKHIREIEERKKYG